MMGGKHDRSPGQEAVRTVTHGSLATRNRRKTLHELGTPASFFSILQPAALQPFKDARSVVGKAAPRDWLVPGLSHCRRLTFGLPGYT